MLPLERHDFIEAAASQDQQAGGDDGGDKLDAFALHLSEYFTDSLELGRAQESLALLLRVLLDVLGGFDPSGRRPHISAKPNILEMISMHRLAS